MQCNEFKEVYRTYYYFDDIIKIEDFNFDNILINEKSNKNVLVNDISNKNLFGSKPLPIRFNEVDGFIRVYDGTRYLTLLGSEIYDAIYNRIRYFISRKSDIKYVFSHNYAKIKIDSDDSLPLEKTFIFQNDPH